MDFKTYISALFYLREAQRYASEPMQVAIQNNIRHLNEEAFLNTRNVCFKLYNDLKAQFPELDFYQSPKESFKKTSISLQIRRELTEEEKLKYPLSKDEDSCRYILQSSFCTLNGDVNIESRVLRRYDDVFILFSSITLNKARVYSQDSDLDRLRSEIAKSIDI